jgi:hypothetical protein
MDSDFGTIGVNAGTKTHRSAQFVPDTRYSAHNCSQVNAPTLCRFAHLTKSAARLCHMWTSDYHGRRLIRRSCHGSQNSGRTERHGQSNAIENPNAKLRRAANAQPVPERRRGDRLLQSTSTVVIRPVLPGIVPPSRHNKRPSEPFMYLCTDTSGAVNLFGMVHAPDRRPQH